MLDVSQNPIKNIGLLLQRSFLIKIEHLCYEKSLQGIVIGQTNIIKPDQVILHSKLNEKVIFEFYGKKMGDGLNTFNSAKVSLHKKSNTLIYNSGLQSLNSASPIPTGLKALSLSSYHKTTASSPKKAMKPALSKKSLKSIEVVNPQPNQSFTLQKKLTQLLHPKRHKKTQSDQIPHKFQ